MCTQVYWIAKIYQSKENYLILEFFEVVVQNRVQLLHSCKKCPYSEFFWSVFSHIPNKRKYAPEKLRMRTLFAQ